MLFNSTPLKQGLRSAREYNVVIGLRFVVLTIINSVAYDYDAGLVNMILDDMV
jgi:hypothetical protein